MIKKVPRYTGLILCFLLAVAFHAQALEATLSSAKIKAGEPITVKGKINPGQDVFVVIATEKFFSAKDSPGPKNGHACMTVRMAKMPLGTLRFRRTITLLPIFQKNWQRPLKSPKGKPLEFLPFRPLNTM